MLQFHSRRHVSGRAAGAVQHEETLGGNLLQRLQQISGGQEGAGLRSVADEQQKERVGAQLYRFRTFRLKISFSDLREKDLKF